MNSGMVKTVSIVVLINAALAGGWWYIFAQVQRAESSAVTLAETISAAEAKQENIRALTVFLQGIDSDRAKIGGAFVDSGTLIHFIEEVERSAVMANVKLVIESATLPPTENDYPSFRLKAEGGFSGVYRFLSLLETMRYHVVWDGVELRKDDARKIWSGLIEFRLLSFSH